MTQILLLLLNILIKLFLIHCRQIRPSDTNVPGKCLSDSANEINRRKLLINAEVTAITTLIELIGGVTLIIHLYFKKGSTFSTFLHTIVIKCAVMPYAFLMNTSHNKDRIVEKGWKNVLMNIFNHPWFAFFIQKSIVTISNNTKDEAINSKAPNNSRISPKKEYPLKLSPSRLTV